MTSRNQQLIQVLRAADMKLTTARQLVFSSLLQRHPQTIAELIDSCTPSIDRVSVYRTIDLFERLGIIRRLQIGWKYQIELSDAFHDHHHHMTCELCGKTTALPEDVALERRLHQAAAAQGFQVREHQLDLTGICADCVS